MKHFPIKHLNNNQINYKTWKRYIEQFQNSVDSLYQYINIKSLNYSYINYSSTIPTNSIMQITYDETLNNFSPGTIYTKSYQKDGDEYIINYYFINLLDFNNIIWSDGTIVLINDQPNVQWFKDINKIHNLYDSSSKELDFLKWVQDNKDILKEEEKINNMDLLEIPHTNSWIIIKNRENTGDREKTNYQIFASSTGYGYIYQMEWKYKAPYQYSLVKKLIPLENENQEFSLSLSPAPSRWNKFKRFTDPQKLIFNNDEIKNLNNKSLNKNDNVNFTFFTNNNNIYEEIIIECEHVNNVNSNMQEFYLKKSYKGEDYKLEVYCW